MKETKRKEKKAHHPREDSSRIRSSHQSSSKGNQNVVGYRVFLFPVIMKGGT
jgi:hypothetical protein